MSRTWEQLVEAGSRAVDACGRAVTAFQWELGDLDCEVETAYGADSVARYAAEVGVEHAALLSYGRVAKAYRRYERSPYLSWSGHQILVAQADRAQLVGQLTTVREASQIAAARRTGNERAAADGPVTADDGDLASEVLLHSTAGESAGRQLEESPARLRAILDALPDATAVLDSSGVIVSVNHTWRMFAVDNGGRPERTGIGVNYLDVCTTAAANGCHDGYLAAEGLRAVLAGSTVQSELEYPCPSPAVNRWFLLRITPLAGHTLGAVVSHVNITRRVMAEQLLAHRATHDPLTGLANRSLLTEQLNAALAQRPGRPEAGQVGVLFLDVDNFKQLNDTYGHGAGDEALLIIGHRLRAAVRSDHFVARLGGDEFAIIAPRIDAQGLDALAGRLHSALSEPHLIHGQTIRILVSIGIHHAAAGEPADEALRNADRAMYIAKRRNRQPAGEPGPGQPPARAVTDE